VEPGTVDQVEQQSPLAREPHAPAT
jgi:hypothetical protein